ncbi:MAG: response regulator [Nitrososphaeraceae archaeon]
MVDQYEDEVTLFTEACERFGFELRAYDKSIAALENFQAGFYDIAIVDILMPVMNGLELSRKLMEIDKLIAIIYLTPNNLRTEVINKGNPNLQWVVTRPVRVRKFIEEINSVLALKSNMPLL